MNQSTLEIRLLGKLTVLRAGEPLSFPPSKKTRALLAYFVATGCAHPRQQLCDLLWEGPADPRAALRWSLTKLRPLLNDDRATRLVTDRDHVRFEPHGADVDLTTVRELAGPKPADAPTEALQEAASHFRGDFLEGLDLPECYRFDAWCTAEREAVRQLHKSILSTLTNRLLDQPEAALRYARKRLVVDPLSEDAHLDIVRLLGKMGRTDEALDQYDTCRQMLEQEFGRRPSQEMEKVRRALTRAGLDAVPPTPSPSPSPSPSLVGRHSERDAFKKLLATAEAGTPSRVLLLTGEPGIGKTRLLKELEAQVCAAGGRVLFGSAFDVERVRPYGPWIDALRSVPTDQIPPAVRPELAPLLPELGPVSENVTNRNRLFDAVLRLLVGLAAEKKPAAVVLDDLHWFDEASAALLHFVARGVSDSDVLLACAARDAELEANSAAYRLVRALRRKSRLRRLDLAPLDASDTARLVQGIDPHLDTERIFTESAGNPLFALEIARALQHDENMVSDTLETLIAGRLANLNLQAQKMMPWAAALGHNFHLETLFKVTDLPSSTLLHAVEELERSGIIEASASDTYDFTHDLIRRVAYHDTSEPRRRMIHLQIARALQETDALDETVAGDVAHHAALGGEPELAARACIAAGRRSLRMFAYEEAAALAARGLEQITTLSRKTRLPLHLDLLGLYVHPGMQQHRPSDLEDKLRHLIGEARAAGLTAQERTGFFLISTLYYWHDDLNRALDTMLRGEEAGRAADPATVVSAIAEAARCLALLEREMARAEKLAQEAQSLAEEAGLEIEGCELPMALALLRHHAGELDEACQLFERAIPRARRGPYPWEEYHCLSRLPMIELERDRPSEALARCHKLSSVAQKMGGGSEAPFARALEALARLALGENGAANQIDEAVEKIRLADSKWMLAYVQNVAAELDFEAGHLKKARRRAEDALNAATVINRRSEMALARALLARLALQGENREKAARYLDAVREDFAKPHVLSARARRAVEEASQPLTP